MKRTLLLLTILCFLPSCHAQKTIDEKQQKGVGSPWKTKNSNNPYIYKNGFLNYSIVQIPIIRKNDTITINKLKFNAVYSSFYTKKVILESGFKNYG